MKKSSLFILSVLFLLAACSQPDKNELQKKVEEAESKLFDQNDSFKFDEALAQNAVDAYANFANSFPKDSLTPGILFKEADLLRAMHKYEAALDIYKKMETEYSNHPKAPHSLFLQGFVYENEVGDLKKAEEKYKVFLEKYPDHDLSDDVQFSLNNLGKSPEEIIQEFNRKQNAAKQDSIL
jgi:TolA-binding protein